MRPAIVSVGRSGVVVREGWGKRGRVEVMVPMTTSVASGARLIGVPEIIIAGAPGMSVWPSMM